MDYQSTLTFLYERLPMFQRTGPAAYKEGLDNTIALNSLTGNPEKSLKCVHIAGTNGKGSVAHFTASILQEAGYRTALFTSPHLRDFRERIKVNGVMIPEKEVVRFVETYKGLFEPIHPSFFELTFAMAMWFFRLQKTDIAVIEAGMGGRLDSTNTVNPVISVITNISNDHAQFLGNTLQKIAMEKAGIIKKGVPVVVGETQKEVQKIFEEKAIESEALLVFADAYFSVQVLETYSDNSGQLCRIFRNGEAYTDCFCPLGGDYQKKNLVTVAMVITQLIKEGWAIGKEKIPEGIGKVVANTGLKGRWQVIGRNPLTIADAAHNEAGLMLAVEQAMSMPYANIHFVLGFVADKDLQRILRLFPPTASFYFCRPPVPRGLDENALKERASECGLTGESFSTVAAAFAAAAKAARADDLIYIGGSAFVVAEVV